MATSQTLLETALHSRLATENWLTLDGREFRLVGKTIRLGRALDNDITLEHKSASRYHALLTIQNGRIFVEDLKSRNGVKVNGQRIKRFELKDGDELHIGDLKGLFFKRLKEQAKFKFDTQINELDIEILKKKVLNHSLVQKFQQLDKPKKIAAIAVAVVVGLSFVMMITGGSNNARVAHAGVIEQNIPELEKEIVQAKIDRTEFLKCLEMEDLGNLRESAYCFDQLAFTKEVALALKRVKSRQIQLTKKRFLEAKQAFDNYYYDIAILKWQEVLLISDEESKFRADAMKGIRDAEIKKNLR